MFYGRTSGGGEYGKSGAQKRNDRYEQMTKQQELIEQKKREIQARLEAERQKKETEVVKKTDGSSKSPVVGRGVTSSASSATNKQSCKDEDDDDDDEEDEDDKSLVKEEAKPKIMFSNDGSFLEQFKRMQELQKKQQEEEEAKKEVKVKEEPAEVNEYGTTAKAVVKPLIKIINVPARSASPAQDSSTTGSRNSMTTVPPPNLYNQDSYSQQGSSNNEVEQKFYPRGGYQNVPPPPPPPPPPPAPSNRTPGFPSQVVKELAAQVAEGGDHIEDMARVENQDDPLMWFLFRPDSNEYRKYRELVSEIRIEFENRPGKQPLVHSTDNKRKNDSTSSEDEYRRNTRDEYGGRPNRNRKRRSRWGPEPDSNSGSSFGHPVSQSPPPVNQGSSFRPDGPPPNVTIQGGLVGPGPMVQGIPPPGIAGFPGLTVPPKPGFSQTQFMMNAGVPPPPPPPPAGPGPSSSAPWGAMPGSSVDQKPLLGVNFPPVPPLTLPPKDQPMLIKVTRTNPQLLAYAQQAYGTTNLDEEQWKQCEEAFKMNLLFQDIARKKSKDEKLQQAGKFKHEYDSDEEYEEGTWEHKQRMKEMEKTRDWADDLTSKAKGKHHIGDFLPPDELAKFMEKFKAVKEGRPIDMSDYQDAKLNESNLGFKMLQKMGWTDGQGLGSSGQGITAPIDKGNAVTDKQGLGQDKPGDLNEEDDEYTAYRKRMMLAYRFRPNPLNNPRRAYY